MTANPPSTVAMNEQTQAPLSEAKPAKPSSPKREAGARGVQPYGADQIKILEGLDAVRKRPGMYIGDTGPAGLHHLVWEAVDNSIDECMAGRATMVAVRVHADGSVSVTDDGSGIPIEPKKHENPLYDGKPAVELVMTLLHAGGKFGEEGSAYQVSGGLHGVGISCVNALSEWLDVEVYRDGGIHRIGFERGRTKTPLHKVSDIGPDSPRRTGTKVHFKPDHTIFPDITFNAHVLSHRLRELAYLNPGVTIRFTDERVGADGSIRDETFRFEKGISEYVAHLNHAKTTLHDIVYFAGEIKEAVFSCEVAMQYNDSYNELILTFANNIRTVDGGTHLSGFKTALTRTLNNYAKQAGLIKEKDPMPTGDDWREGLAAVISVKLREPQFEGQTKGKLRNTEVEGYVSQIVSEKLAVWLDEHPSDARKICGKGLLAAQAREAARKARDLTRRKSALESGSMPHKLRDCTTKDVGRSEMFIVEGDSAGGSATQGRDVETQAILPLRGKLLNVEKARLDKVLAFEEIRTLISALRCGIGEEFDISKLRYDRIVIMTDADVDGSHIRTLLLTFFFRQMPELIRRSKIYIAQPPLYLITRGKKSQYVLNEQKMSDVLVELGLDGSKLLIREVPDSAEPHRAGEPVKVVRTLEGEELRRAVRLLRRLAELSEIVERRGIRFADLLDLRRQDPEGRNRLPSFRVQWSGGRGISPGDAFAWSEEQVQAILDRTGLRRADLDAEMRNSAPAGNGNGSAPSHGDTHENRLPAVVRELHENRELASLFAELAALGLDIEDYALTQEEAVTGEKLPTKYAWQTTARASAHQRKHEGSAAAGTQEDDGKDSTEAAEHASGEQIAPEQASGVAIIEAPNIPSILTTLLDVGRRGMEVKRFKGLGEMDPGQLWETTMDPARRTLLRVNWDDASAADELFTILMGENVEERRTYIEEHALEVKSVDV